jgi:uncharacterized protein YecE (DUF72 family)
MGNVYLGTAGWSIPRQNADSFPSEGTSLERYAGRLPVTEINSSFHRPHRISTWARWRDSVPAEFRFSVKVPKLITHQRKLVDCELPLADFAEQVETLGEKLAVLLVQLPPKLAFDPDVALAFFSALHRISGAAIACEPRHISWFNDEVDSLLGDAHVVRVAADPAICEAAARPGGWRGLSYWRLHGSPVIYRSSYADRVDRYAALLSADSAQRDVWCIFDNTASSAGAGDALALADALRG